MSICVLKSKIHRAIVTESDLNYVGSIEIDKKLLDIAGIISFEKVLVVNLSNGERWETYALPAAQGSKKISVNGGGARLALEGDIVVIMAFEYIENSGSAEPINIIIGDNNEIDNIIKGSISVDEKNRMVRL